MAIALSVQLCLTAFQARAQDVELSMNTELLDELGRFRTWVGNISAHRTGRRSLEYRLRDSSNLQRSVLALLEDVRESLDQIRKVSAGSAPSFSGESTNADQDEADFFELDDEDEQDSSPIEQALDKLHEVITCLLRLSMALRNPARHDQMKRGATSTAKFYEPKDIEHVTTKYPAAPQHLAHRLGKTISRHRQYFKYRVEHHEKLREGLGEDEGEERPSTVATSIRNTDHAQINSKTMDLDTESMGTATSYAPTMSVETSLRPPPWPEAGQEGEPFECPICYSLIVAQSERSWRQHVYEDLPPYVCTFRDCSTADRPFARRRDWQRHELRMHDRAWSCPFDCPEPIMSADLFENHINRIHDQHPEPSALQRIIDSCARPNEHPGPRICVLCGKEKPTPKLMHKHLGHHLEQLALFALPNHILSGDAEEDANDASNDEDMAEPSGRMSSTGSLPFPGLRRRRGGLVDNGSDDGSLFGENDESSLLVGHNALGEEHDAPIRALSDSLRESEQETERRRIADENPDLPHSPDSRQGGQSRFDMAKWMSEWEWKDFPPAGKEREEKEKAAKTFEKESIATPSNDTEKPNHAGWRQEQEKRILEEQNKQESEGTLEILSAEEKEEREWKEFLLEQKESKEKEEAAQKVEKEKIDTEMRRRLARLGYTQDQIEIMVDEEAAKGYKQNRNNSLTTDLPGATELFKPKRGPIYSKIHQDYLSVDTLIYYDIPYKIDSDDANYIIILREMDKYETEVLFEHTKRLRAGKSENGSKRPVVTKTGRDRSPEGMPSRRFV